MPKKITKKEKPVEEEVLTCESCEKSVIDPITQEFGNGDMNVLRDKINEIISKR